MISVQKNKLINLLIILQNTARLSLLTRFNKKITLYPINHRPENLSLLLYKNIYKLTLLNYHKLKLL